MRPFAVFVSVPLEPLLPASALFAELAGDFVPVLAGLLRPLVVEEARELVLEEPCTFAPVWPLVLRTPEDLAGALDRLAWAPPEEALALPELPPVVLPPVPNTSPDNTR